MHPPTPSETWGNFGETKDLTKKTPLTLTLVRLCEVLGRLNVKYPDTYIGLPIYNLYMRGTHV